MSNIVRYEKDIIEFLEGLIKDPGPQGVSGGASYLLKLIKGEDPLKTAKDLLVDVVNDYEDEGCEDCGTISAHTHNKIRKFLGYK